MAEGVLFNIAGDIIKILTPLVTEEVGLLWNFQNDLEDLEITVSTIRDVLLDAEKQQAGSHTVRGWLRKVNNLLYEADDFLDAISTDAQRQELMIQKAKQVRIFFSKSNQLIYGLRMGHKIKEIGKKFDGVAATIKNFQFLVQPVEAPRDWKRNDTHSYLSEEILGRDNDEKNLKKLLMSNVGENISIVSIFGLGGMGKTTLAQSICKDEEIKKCFELKMWVCVSDNFNVKDIIEKISMEAKKDLPRETQGEKENPETSEMGTLGRDEKALKGKKGPDSEIETLMRDILKTLKGMKGPDKVMERLMRDLLEAIEGKKFLLVLDDVWEDSSVLSDLKSLLKVGGKGSKILITTRKESVGTIMQAEQYPLDNLDNEASWELFKRVAFENEKESYSFKEKGEEILKKCRGVPLAIKTMGRLLHSKSLERWQEFITKEFSQIPQQVDDILPTLKLSYNDLPSHLKLCFGYCSLFPKDYKLDKVTLINLWIAQGYIESEENQCLEDIGNEYFLNLLWRSFFQEAQIDKFGNIVGCKIHDLMHDLAVSVAWPLIITFPSKESINYKRTHHVAVSYDVSSYAKLSPLYKASRMRTFLCPTMDEIHSLVKIDCEAILKGFKFLRVLDLSRRKLKHVPSSIGKLKHLRYLDLSKNEEIKKLPNSITMLVNLKSLCLSSCYRLIKLPRFGQLVNLRHFDVSSCEGLRSLPHGMGQLTNLHVLNLKDCRELKSFSRGMTRLTNLQVLNLNNCYGLEELPRAITGFVNLKHLNIQGCKQFNYLPSGIGKLTNLQVLTDFMVSSGSLPGDGGGLAELNGLNNLRGHLTIRSLGYGNLADYKVANLMGKENLSSLCLEWNTGGVIDDIDDDMSMDGLKPHQNLKCLQLHDYCGPRHPSWLSSLTSIVSLLINGCTKWQHLTPLNHLVSLESLELCKMKGLEYISNLGEQSDFSLFPSLKEMTLTECPNLKGWWGASSQEDDNLALSFRPLSKLEIRECPILTSMPMFPHLEKPLVLKNTSWKPLQQTLMMNTATSMTSSNISNSLGTPLSKLKKIEFDLVVDLEALLEEGFQNLTSLEILTFSSCTKLKSLSPGVQYLMTVQILKICDCSAFAEDEDGIQWQGLKSLRHLQFCALPKLSSLPLGLQHVTSLKVLWIEWCRNLTTIAEWIHQCKSLEDLTIRNCPNLASLPVETCERWSLKWLEIEGCPILSQKCEKEKGEYWPKIAHIPQLYVEPQPKSKSALQRMFRKNRDG